MRVVRRIMRTMKIAETVLKTLLPLSDIILYNNLNLSTTRDHSMIIPREIEPLPESAIHSIYWQTYGRKSFTSSTFVKRPTSGEAQTFIYNELITPNTQILLCKGFYAHMSALFIRRIHLLSQSFKTSGMLQSLLHP